MIIGICITFLFFFFINYTIINEKAKLCNNDMIRYNDIVNPNITSNVEFHNRYNIIIIPLIEQDQISIITDIIKKKLSKHKKNLIKRFR